MTAPPLWRLQSVSLSGRARDRLSDVTLEIPQGVTAILGASGAGKTSLLNLLVGFERPGNGRIDRLASGSESLPLFWGPPDFGLWPHLTVRQHIAAVTSGSAAFEQLAGFDLAHLADAHPATLSQGERSRLCVARAVASGATTLVLDEPLAHLNGTLQETGWQTLREAMRQDGRSLVFSTHQPEVAFREANWCVLLDAGQILATGTPQSLYHTPATREIAELMGPGTWLSIAETATWFGSDGPSSPAAASQPGCSNPAQPGCEDGVCIRPEQLRIEGDPESPLIVESAVFLGPCEETILRNATSGRIQKFAHRPSRPVLKSGMRVALQWLCVAIAVLGAGCSVDGPELVAVQEDFWTLPPDGLKIPAPRAITATPDGTVYVLDNVGRVLAFDPVGKPLKHWWMPEYVVGRPERILETRDGRLVVADTHYNRIVIFDADGNVELIFGRKGEAPGEFIYPVAVAEDDRQNLYVCEYGGHDRVQVFRPDGTYVSEFGSFGTGPGQFQRPSGILWRDGKLYIADAFNNRIHIFTEEGEPQDLPPGAFAADLHYPYDIAVSPAGDFYVVEYGGGRVTRFSSEGVLLGRYGSTGNDEGCFNTPWGLSVDNEGRVLVADTGNRRVVQVTFAK